MGLIECKCHACGGTLKVNEQATGQLMCPFCGTPYLAEQAINNYYTTVNNTTINNIQAGTVVINTHNIDALVKNGLDIIESGFMKTVAPIVIDTTRFTVEKGRVDELNGIREKIIGMDADNFYGHYFSLVLGGHSKSDLDICSHFEDKEKANIILDFISERLVGAFNFFENERLSSADLHCNITDTVDTSVFGCLKRAGLELIDEAKKYPERWNALVSDQKYQLINDRLLEGLKRVLRVLLEIAKTTAQLNSYDIKNLKCKIFGGVSAYLKVVDYVECDEECRELVGKIQSTILNNIDKLTKLEGGCDAIKPVFTLEHKEELFAQSIHMTDTALVFNRDGKVVFHGHGVDFYINGQKFESINAKDVLCVGYNRQPQVNSISEWYASAYVFFKIDEEHYTAIWIQRYFNGMFLEDKNSPEYQMAENWAAVIGVKFETSLNPFTYWEHPRPYEGYQHVDYSKYKRIPGKSKIKWCYVATCVYGSYDCPEVWVLRRFRDYKLDKTWYGKAFIKVYYAISPIFVKLFGKTKWFKTMWKGVLDKMVEKYKAQGFEDTPYNDLY